MGASGVSGLTSHLTEYLKQMQGKQLETLADPADAVADNLPGLQADAVTISEQGYAKNQNLLANQGAQAEEKEKSYLDKKIDSFSSQQTLRNSMDSALGSSLESAVAQAAFWYGDKRMRNAKMMKDASESHQEVFAEIKDTIDEKAAEATVPKDKEGKPIEQAGTTSVPESAPAQTVAAPVAQAVPAPTSEVAVGLERVSQAAPAVASISIKV
jgi:hypothetical protein